MNTELLTNNFHIQIKNEIWKDNTEYINEKNQTVNVQKDSMKLTLSISGWEFLNSDNTLTLDFTISNNLGNDVLDLQDNTIKMHEFDFMFENTAIVDNVEKPVNLYILGNKYYLELPSFVNDLYYDPTISVGNDSNQILPSSLLIFCLYLSRFLAN